MQIQNELFITIINYLYLTFNIPVIGLDTWNLEPYCAKEVEGESAVAAETEEGERQKIIPAKTPEEAVDMAIKKAKEVL